MSEFKDMKDNQVSCTMGDLAKAFETWEEEYRQSPEDFFTADEVSAMETASFGERSAIALAAYLRKVGA